MALAGTCFCLTGTLSKGRAEVQKEIAKNGGEFANGVTKKVTHLVSSADEYEGTKTSKILDAEGKGIYIVREAFLWDAIKAGKLPPVGKYRFGSGGDAAAAAAPVKSKAAVAPHGAPPAKKPKLAADGKVAVHPKSGWDPATTEVLLDADEALDVEMVYQDIAANMDKFYDMQALQDTTTGQYHVFQHWGRVGTSGQVKKDGPFSDSSSAVSLFGKKFKEKCGFSWGEAGGYSPAKAGKYTVVARQVAADESYTWEYHKSDGKKPGWHPYDASAIEKMERCFAQFQSNKWLSVRYVYSGAFTYKVDFAANSQTNQDHPAHTTRNIRRKKK